MKALDKTFFHANRERVIELLKGSVLIVPSYASMQRSNDTAFRFEQEANFWYLTGISQPDWWLIIDSKRAHSTLVAPTVDDVHALFDGTLSAQDARTISGVDEIIDAADGMARLRHVARTHRLVYMVDQPSREHFNFTLNPAARDMREQLTRLFETVQDFRPKLATLRAIKSAEEIAAMQAAIDLTIEGFEQVRERMQTYKYEYEIEADFTHVFRGRGADGHAYDPIVAAGDHACTLHYIENNGKLKKGSLVLLDIGARACGYAADITRTYAYGTATKRQKAVHAAVAQAQAECIDLLAPGKPVATYIEAVDDSMSAALARLNLVTDSRDERYRRYFPHAISHGLGIDVHDALGKPTVFVPGMVLTVEPGIYIPEEGIGVRIEDDILITETGHRNLSAKLSTSLA